MSGWRWNFLGRMRNAARPARLAAGLWIGCIAAAACAGQVDDGKISGAQCGPTLCSDAEYCCDARCGLCVAQEVECRDTCGSGATSATSAASSGSGPGGGGM